MYQIKVACISDSPKKYTGFGTVVSQLYPGLQDAGLDLRVFGLHDFEHDDGQLPYSFFPTSPLDPMGSDMALPFLRKMRPDIIFLMADPGTLRGFVEAINEGKADHNRPDGPYRPPIVAYVPLEGIMVPDAHVAVFQKIEDMGGVVVLYSPGMVEILQRQHPHLDPEFVYHGSDHIEPIYSPDDIALLRQFTGLSQYFVVGAFGVNKRTKGFPDIIQVARLLKDLGHDDFLFYLHTEKHNETDTIAVSPGHPLKNLARYYGVEDMILFKPDTYQHRGGTYEVAPRRDRKVLDMIGDGRLEAPSTAQQRGFWFGQLDFTARMMMMDCYLDLSAVEGWGLPQFEAMALGVPLITFNDHAIRREVHAQGAFLVEPLPETAWDHWHTGGRLIKPDLEAMAQAVLQLRDETALRDRLAQAGQEVTSHYKWAESGRKMADIIQNVYALVHVSRQANVSAVKSDERVFRPGTFDYRIWVDVVQNNEYRLPPDLTGRVIIDLGGHIGSFAFACLDRNAKRVYMMEMDKDNLKAAHKNLASFGERARLYHGAIWRSDKDLSLGQQAEYPAEYPAFMGLLNTGGLGTVMPPQVESREMKAAPIWPLDEFISAVLVDEWRIDLLKIDIESAEWEVLATSRRLGEIKEIVGEFHEIGGKFDDHDPGLIDLPGYNEYTVEVLEQILTGKGFTHFDYSRWEIDGLRHIGHFRAVQG